METITQRLSSSVAMRVLKIKMERSRHRMERLVLPSSFSWLSWLAGAWIILAPFLGGQNHLQIMETLQFLWANYPVSMVIQMAAMGILSARLLSKNQMVLVLGQQTFGKQSENIVTHGQTSSKLCEKVKE
jgi:hypothetical protein